MEKKKKGGKRQKGLQYVREVREILERDRCEVEGPGYGLRFFGNKKSQGNLRKEGGEQKTRPVLVHADYFKHFDLISYRPDLGYIFHQVSILEEKSRKVDDLIQANMPGWIWGRFYEGVKVAFRIFSVRDTTVIERGEVIFLTPPKKVEDFGLAGAQRKVEITLFEKGAEQWTNSLNS